MIEPFRRRRDRGMRPALTARLAVAAVGAALLGLATAACGSGPTTPSPSGASVAGAWTGTWQFVTAGATVTDAVTATLAQNGASASGTWQAQSGASGQVSFATTGTLSGTISISVTSLSGQNCSASTTVSGTANDSRITLVLAALPSSGVCQWATNQRFELTR